MAEDRVMDAATGTGENIGTTQRGIGPCYRDKVGRSLAIRMGDMYCDNFRERVEHIVAEKREALAQMNGDAATDALDAEAIYKTYSEYAERLKPHVADTTAVLLDAVDADKNILFEGAQGSLLDIDHGTFPYVTSSNSSGVGVCAGAGVPPKFIDHTIGIVKAYSTRVGGGPFPTEQENEYGQHLRDKGNEYGTVTRRPRRCGWFDSVAVRYTARLGGVDTLAIMLLDVLSGLEEIKICTAYEIDGRQVTDFPSHVDDLRKATPVYETLPGWSAEIDHVTDYGDLPPEAHAYLDRVSELIGRPVEVVSVGPARAQTIVREVELVG
ncbi:MAG: adenylosuccinate synthetase, partial [Pirellulales bacterium]|nr:adenylosuccinate synthetase [Pirellulales bacterium]